MYLLKKFWYIFVHLKKVIPVFIICISFVDSIQLVLTFWISSKCHFYLISLPDDVFSPFGNCMIRGSVLCIYIYIWSGSLYIFNLLKFLGISLSTFLFLLCSWHFLRFLFQSIVVYLWIHFFQQIFVCKIILMICIYIW